MPDAAGTASAASSSATQSPTGASTDWMAEKARLEAELGNRDNQIRALAQIKHAWEKNIGKELEGVIEYDSNGFPVKVNYGDGQMRQPYTGVNPLAAGGVVDAQTAQQYDDYLRSQLGAQFVTPQQLQAQVNAAAQQAYLAATTRFETLRTVDRTVNDPRFKELGDFGSPLSKKTMEVMARNGWGSTPSGAAKSWEDYQYAAPNALTIAAQIAKAELFESNQQSQQSNATAQAAQAAAGISSGGGTSAGVPPPSTDEMVKLFRDDPVKAEALARQQFEQKTGVGLGR